MPSCNPCGCYAVLRKSSAVSPGCLIPDCITPGLTFGLTFQLTLEWVLGLTLHDQRLQPSHEFIEQQTHHPDVQQC